MKKIRVFIVEDSVLMQKVLKDILSSSSDIEVVGSARLGKEALELIPQLNPDVITLDVNLPDISGLTVLNELMQKHPVKVVMLSAYTQKGADFTFKALEAGALDFIPKPSGEISLDLYNFKEEIISKIKLVGEIELEKALSVIKKKVSLKETLTIDKIVVIGASTGGPKAILEIMSNLPQGIEASFLIVQHMPYGFTKSFAERLSWYSPIKIKEAEDGEVIVKGAGYVAPSGFHMIIEKDEQEGVYRVRLDETPLVNYVRPAVDITMQSVAEIFDGKIIGVILTGMGKDGLEGAKAIKIKGGKIIAQDESSCVVYGMSKAVVEAKLADSVVPLSLISKVIVDYLKG
jgi:two-component system chemotaxis response regulator CheB